MDRVTLCARTGAHRACISGVSRITPSPKRSTSYIVQVYRLSGRLVEDSAYLIGLISDLYFNERDQFLIIVEIG